MKLNDSLVFIVKQAILFEIGIFPSRSYLTVITICYNCLLYL